MIETILMRTVKMIFGLILILTVVVGCQMIRNSGSDAISEPPQSALRLGTYNVHYIIAGRKTGAWSVGDWERRKTPLDLAFKALGADAVAFQEMESFARGDASQANLTLDWLLAQNPDYAAAAVGNPATFPSTQPILFRKDRLDALDQGWFFFSETPDVIYSRTFNGSYPAFASWARFKDRIGGAEFRILNLHTDFGSRSNRQKSIELVADRIRPWIETGEPLFVMGDFNALLNSALLKILRDEGLEFIPVSGSTYHLNRGLNLFGAIDHIGYINGPSPAGTPMVIRKKFAGEWPTDHYPVIADFTLNP